MDKEEIKTGLRGVTYTMPVQGVFSVVDNPEYDPQGFSEEIDAMHTDEEIGELYSSHPIGPVINWYDDEPVVEDPEWKKWRLNHNKKFRYMLVHSILKPKRKDDGTYYVTDEELETHAEQLKDFNNIYSYHTSLFEALNQCE